MVSPYSVLRVLKDYGAIKQSDATNLPESLRVSKPFYGFALRVMTPLLLLVIQHPTQTHTRLLISSTPVAVSIPREATILNYSDFLADCRSLRSAMSSNFRHPGGDAGVMKIVSLIFMTVIASTCTT